MLEVRRRPKLSVVYLYSLCYFGYKDIIRLYLEIFYHIHYKFNLYLPLGEI